MGFRAKSVGVTVRRYLAYAVYGGTWQDKYFKAEVGRHRQVIMDMNPPEKQQRRGGAYPISLTADAILTFQR